MGCCSIPMPDLKCEETPTGSQMTYEIAMNCISKNDRKALRLLSKQYEIYSITKDAPDFQDQKIVRETPLVIKYFSPENPNFLFDWVIKDVQLINF